MLEKKRSFRIIILVVIIFMFLPSKNLVEAKTKDKKTLIFMVDNLSFSQVEAIGAKNKSIGLMNLKTRKPYNEESLYRSLNVGRKISRKELDKRDIKLEYMGDILRDEGLFYWSDGIGNIDLLISDSQDQSEGNISKIVYEIDWLEYNIDKVFDSNNILAMEYNIEGKDSRFKTLNNIIEYNNLRDRRIYLIPREVSEEDKYFINEYLVPVILIGEESGLITSNSTKREGIIALEDVSEDIKDNYTRGNASSIGSPFIIEENNEIEFKSESIYKGIINLLVIASICHGLVYLSQALMLFNIVNTRSYSWIDKFYLFSTNNILLTILLSFTDLYNNLFIYLILLFFMNILLTKLMYRKKEVINLTFITTYILVVLGIVMEPNLIYNSYMGFNNLIYGARFYGFNNGMVAVLLSTSILTASIIERTRLTKLIKKPIILLIPLINILILSTRLAANTGGFITAIFLLLLSIYYYFMPKGRGIRTVVLFLFLGLTIFGFNIYVDSLGHTQGHALQFINRIRENGIVELFYMGGFKLKELLRLTIMPPFSLVLISQVIILKNIYRHRYIVNKLLLITGILGFLINDTGNILLIYMLNYLILRIHFYKEEKIFVY